MMCGRWELNVWTLSVEVREARSVSKIPSRKSQNRRPESPKSTFGGRKSSQDRLGGSRSGQERPRSVPRSPQERPRGLKSIPRAPRGGSRGPQNRPRAAPRDLQRRTREPWGTIFWFGSSKKASFDSDLSRDSVKGRVCNDFRSILDPCVQAGECEPYGKTYVFFMFFRGRSFFQRVIQL